MINFYFTGCWWFHRYFFTTEGTFRCSSCTFWSDCVFTCLF